jgi:hypothetical protein
MICGFQELLDPVWKIIAIPMFFVSTLMWDSLSLFLTPSGPVASPVSRKTRRSVARWIRFHQRDSSWSAHLLFGCAVWPVMSSCIMAPAHIDPSKSCDHPFSVITSQVCDTYRRIDALSSMVDLSPGTFSQYQRIKGRELWSDVHGPEDEVIPKDVLHPEDYFDSYEDLPIYRETFFDTRENLDSTDYEHSPRLPLDMGIADLVCPRIRIDCTSDILDTILDGTPHSCTPTEDTSVFQGEFDIFHTPTQRALAALIDHGVCSPVSPVANSTGGSTINPKHQCLREMEINLICVTWSNSGPASIVGMCT